MRPLFKTLVPALGLAATLATPIAAHAEEGEGYPLVFGQRPMTLDEGMFVATGEFSFFKAGEGADMAISLNGLVDYGVIENLTVGALAAPLGLSPEAEYGNPSIYGRYRFLRGATPVELGVELRATFPVLDGTKFGLAPGLLGSWQINDAAQLNFGVYVPLTFSDPIAKGLAIPIELAISFTRNIFLQAQTGINMFDFDPDFLSVPLGVKVGYTLPKTSDTPFLDIYLGFGFPGFLSNEVTITASGTESSLGLNTDSFEFMLGGRLFL